MIARRWSPAACAKAVQQASQVASLPHRSVPLSWCHRDTQSSPHLWHYIPQVCLLASLLYYCCVEPLQCWDAMSSTHAGALQGVFVLDSWIPHGCLAHLPLSAVCQRRCPPALRSRTGKTWVPSFLLAELSGRSTKIKQEWQKQGTLFSNAKPASYIFTAAKLDNIPLICLLHFITCLKLILLQKLGQKLDRFAKMPLSCSPAWAWSWIPLPALFIT